MASEMLFFLTTASIHLCFVIIAVCSKEDRSDILPPFTINDLADRVRNAEEQWPVCVLFTNPARVVTSSLELEGSLYKFLMTATDDSPYKEWTFARIKRVEAQIDANLLPGAPSPVLACYVGTSSSPLTFQPNKHQSSLQRWLKTVKNEFARRLQPLVWRGDDVFQVHQSGYIVIGIPSTLYHALIEDILSQVVKGKDNDTIPVNTYIALPFSREESETCKRFDVTEFPAVVILHKYEWQSNSKMVKVIQGIEMVTMHSLRLSLMVHSGWFDTILNDDNFADEVLETAAPQPPTIVTFYSPRSMKTLNYLHAFKRAQTTFTSIGISARFGVLDITEHPKAVGRYVNATDVRQVPFTVLFWQSKIPGEHKLEIKQKVLHKPIPTPQTLYMFIQENLNALTPSLFMTDSLKDSSYNPFEEHEQSKLLCSTIDLSQYQCLSNESFVQEPSYTVKTIYGPQLPSSTWNYKVSRKYSATDTKKHVIPFLTDSTWASTVERSASPPNQLPIKTAIKETRLFSVTLVVFIQKDCGYCEIVLPELEDIFKSMKYLGASMYLMNCTSDPAACRRHDVTGFPTIIAFRSFSWSVAGGCSSRTQSAYIRLDYHGPIMRNLILAWLSNITQPTVSKRYLMAERIPKLVDEDVRLVATVYTRSLAIRYLPAILHDKWYPYTCLSHACEQLYGHVPCYALYTRAVVDDGSKVNFKDKDKDLFVSSVEFQRIDGVNVKLIEGGTTMERSMNNEADTRLHQFHDTHRYNLPRDFRCEDDHKLCTDTVVKFVQDHRRLPIMHLTTAALHTRQSQLDQKSGSEIFTRELPVLLALVRNENMTKESRFRKELTQAAYAMYREMLFVTLDVEEFAYWASNFVPKDYHRSYAYDLHGNVLPSLYHYPRLCIVRWHDHQHAAFYPPLQEMERLAKNDRIQNRLNSINSQQIIAFVTKFLEDPQAMLVRTEMF